MDNPALIKILDVLKTVAANTGAAIGLPAQNGVKPRDESKLSSNKVKTTKETAQIFSKVFTNSLGGIIADNNKNNISSFASIVGNILKPKKEEGKGGILESLMGNLGKFAGILGIGMGIYYIVNSMMKVGDIPYGKIALGIAALGLFLGVITKFVSGFNLILISASLGVLGYMINSQILPMLDNIGKKDWDTLKDSLKKAGIVVGVLGGFMVILSKLIGGSPMQLLGAAGTLLILTGATLLLEKLITVMDGFQGSKDWDKITENLWKSELALGAFAAVMTGAGALLTGSGGFGAIAAAVGAAASWAAISLMDKLANTMSVFQTLDSAKLSEVGKGIKDLGEGLAKFALGLMGSTSGSVFSSLSKLFNMDPVSKLKEFEKIDTAKFLNIATTFQIFGSAVSSLADSMNKLDSLKGPLKDLKPVSIKIEAVNEFNQSLMDFNKQNLDIQKNQLSELKRNNELLEVIAKGLRNGGGNVLIPVPNEQKSENTSKIPDFSTKTNYLDLLRVTSR